MGSNLKCSVVENAPVNITGQEIAQKDQYLLTGADLVAAFATEIIACKNCGKQYSIGIVRNIIRAKYFFCKCGWKVVQ